MNESVTAIAAIVYFAPDMRRDPGRLIVAGILPGLGALMMVIAFVVSAIQMAAPDYVGASILGIGTVFWIGVGALVLGLIVTFALRPHFKDFFGGRTIPIGKVGDTDFVIADPIAGDSALSIEVADPDPDSDPTLIREGR